MKKDIDIPWNGIVQNIMGSVSDEVFLIVYNTLHQSHTNPTTGSIVLEELYEEEYAGQDIL